MKRIKHLIILLFTTAIFIACSNNAVKDERDSPKQGTIYISVDETFKPVIEEQIKVYESTFQNAHIIASYKSEAECFRDLQKDSTRLIIVARGLNNEEQDFYEKKLRFRAQFDLIAYDAVAIIVNSKSKDSVFTIQKLQNILSGKSEIEAVMDGKNATSTVRYLKDSILKNQPFGVNVVAAKNSEDVVKVIAEKQNAIGFVGLNWIGDNYDEKQQNQLKKVKLALVECVRCVEKGFFAKPSQASISYAQYPLARPLYYILKENTSGLGTGFTNFMAIERGQLIFRRSFLVPAKMNFNKRKSNIKDQDL